MPRLVFDLETNGLLDTVSVVHCIVTKDADTGEVRRFRPDQIEAGLDHLCSASVLIAHNGINYDCQVIRKLYPQYYGRMRDIPVLDTMVLARVIWPEIRQKDFKLFREGRIPGKLIGSHKLEAWGYRLGILKGDYGKQENAWEVFTEEMLEYCVLDVEVTARLLESIGKKNLDPTCSELEHAVAWILADQMQTGFPFDEAAAQELYIKLAAEREEARFQCSEAIRPWYVPVRKHGELVIKKPKVGNSQHGTTKDAPWCPVKLVEFNPGSDPQVADRLQKLCGWEPVEFTENGQPTCTDEVLSALPYPEAKTIGRYRMLDKRIQQLAEGDQAWLKAVKDDGRIYHYINQNGTVTGRGAHSHPNLGQVPASDKEYGPECRALFHVPSKWNGQRWVQLGTDMSGLELRCLGHFLAKYDGGAYLRLVLEGDVHSYNASALFKLDEKAFLKGRKDERLLLDCANEHPGSGEYLKKLAPGARKTAEVKDYYESLRNKAKTFIYAWLYGAGAAKIGKIINRGPKEGKQLIAAFLKRTPALAKLKQKVAQAAERGWLKGLDGRKIPIRSPHSALNTLLQSAGAVLCKKWMAEFHRLMAEAGYVLGRDYFQLAWVHDELQLMVREEIADHAGHLSTQAAALAGEFFRFRCPLTAEFKTGHSWRECH